MREKLEMKIILGVSIMFLIGIVMAGLMTIMIERKNLYDAVELNSETAAAIIAKDIERTMIEARPDITKAMINDMRGLSSIEDIHVVNFEGREAFNKDAPKNESAAMNTILSTKKNILIKDSQKVTLYRPLENAAACRPCHMKDGDIIGAVKISRSIEREYKTAMRTMIIVTLATILGAIGFIIVIWFMLRKMVIQPVKAIEEAATKLADGDLSFHVDIKTKDEITRLSKSMKDSVYSLGSILQKVKDVSSRISHVAGTVEKDSKKMVDSTRLEAEAVADISSAVEELKAAISEITESTEGLAASAEETAAAMDQIAASIGQVTSSTRELSTSVDGTSSSIEELSATIKEVAESAEVLSSATDETLSSIEEMSFAVKEVEQNTKESAKLSEKVMTDASTFGMASIEKTIDGMKNIKVSVEKTNEYIKKLGGRSEEIGKILNVIDEITDQTTLLALNAAILAAQAGEHGKGFSVVADEIKDLAERTTFSTKEIGELIQGVQQEVKGSVQTMAEGLKSVEEGIKLSGEAFDSLNKILESSKKSSEMAFSIERSTGEQAKAIRVVTEAMGRIKNMTGMIAKATSEQSRGVGLIMNAAEKMKEISNQVKSATEEQAANSRHVSEAIEMVSDKSQQISKAIHEQKSGANQIWMSIEKIKDIPKANRDLAFNVNNALSSLLKDAELIDKEIMRFRFAEEKGTGVLKFGVVPLESPAEMFMKFTPMAEYLSKKLGRRVDLKIASDYEEAVNDLGKNITQLCYMTSATYIEAHDKYKVAVIAKMLRDGKPFQHSVLFTRAESKINSIEDIKGRTFAFGDKHSASSHIVPRAVLHEAGIGLNDLQYYNHLAHHDDVVRAVLKGDFDAGATMEDIAYQYQDKGLRILKLSEYIPEFNICVNNYLSKEDVSLFKSALISMTGLTPDENAVLKSIGKNCTGFIDARDEDYDVIRKMMSLIGML